MFVLLSRPIFTDLSGHSWKVAPLMWKTNTKSKVGSESKRTDDVLSQVFFPGRNWIPICHIGCQRSVDFISNKLVFKLLLLLRKLCPLKKTSFEKVFQRLQSFQIKLMAQSQNSFPVAFFHLMVFWLFVDLVRFRAAFGSIHFWSPTGIACNPWRHSSWDRQ